MALRRYGIVALFMSPWIIGFIAFIGGPMLLSLYYSFTSYDLLNAPRWVGLANYRFAFEKDPFFTQSIRNTLWIIGFGVPLRILFAMATAMLLTRARRGANLYRTLFFMPSMAPAVAASLVFVYLLNPATGPVNQALSALHLPAPLWFYDTTWAKPGLLILGLWGIGDAIVIFLAGLLDVPAQLYEAIAIEGAGPWQRFRYVTLPMISPVIFFTLVIGVIEGFQYFTQGYIAGITAGGSGAALGAPQGSTLFYGLYLYQQAFSDFHMGYASALAWMLFVATMVFTVILVLSSRRWVHYAGSLR